MKDVFKVFGTYFALGFGTLTGIGAGLKVCDKLLEKKSDKQNKETEKAKVINFIKESE